MTFRGPPLVATLTLVVACGGKGAREPAKAEAADVSSPSGGVEPPNQARSADSWHELEPQADQAATDTPPPKEDLSFAGSFVGKHPAYLLDAMTSNPGVDTRLRTLLTADYDDWRARFAVASNVERVGGLVVAQGCMAHLCGGARLAMIVIDASRNVISVGLVTDGRGTSRSESGQVPTPLREWLASESTR